MTQPIQIDVYGGARCPYCVRAKKLLDKKGVSYQWYDVWENKRLKQEMTRRAPGSRTVPQIFIGDTHVGGCDELHALDRAGRLDPMLGVDPAPKPAKKAGWRRFLPTL